MVFDRVVVRAQPSVKAELLSVQLKGDLVEGVPCDIDGVPWLQLDSGWMLIDGKSVGLGILLKPAPLKEVIPEGPDVGEQLRERGNAFFREKKYSSAIRAYTEAIDKKPADARVWANRAAAQMGMLQEFGKGLAAKEVRGLPYYQNSLDDLHKALELDPGYCKAWARLGQLHLLVENRGEALAAYEKGLKVDPENADCRAGRESCRISSSG